MNAPKWHHPNDKWHQPNNKWHQSKDDFVKNAFWETDQWPDFGDISTQEVLKVDNTWNPFTKTPSQDIEFWEYSQDNQINTTSSSWESLHQPSDDIEAIKKRIAKKLLFR